MMTLPVKFRNNLKDIITHYVDGLISQNVTPSSQAPKKWKFTNSADFHYGHFVGMMEYASSSLYNMLYFKQIAPEEMKEVEEIIEELGKPFQEYLKTTLN